MPLDVPPAAMTLSAAEVDHLADAASRVDAGGARPAVKIDLSDGLSPDEAALVAVVANPALRAERGRLAVASAELLQARILPNPQLTANVDPVIGGNTEGTTTGYGVGVDWEITALVAHDARVAATRLRSDSVRL